MFGHVGYLQKKRTKTAYKNGTQGELITSGAVDLKGYGERTWHSRDFTECVDRTICKHGRRTQF